MILHGGCDGTLKDYGRPQDYIFNWTVEELQQIDIGDGEKIPTLESLLELSKSSPNVILNIELKVPKSETWFKKLSLIHI